MIDITVPIRHGMVTYEGDPGVSVRQRLSIASGDPANVSEICLGSHTGTHIDAPAHFLDGASTLDGVSMAALLGRVAVVETQAATMIRAPECDALVPADAERVIFKTRNSALWRRSAFTRDYVALDSTAARWLIDRGVRLVGIDYLSIEAFGAAGHPVHKMLLGARVVILEGLDLSAARPGEYELLCLPLRVAGADGAPCRALLRPLSSVS
jgi:arylformamidase